MERLLKILKYGVIFICATILVGCASLQNMLEPPRVSLTNIEILEVSGFSVRFALGLNIQNPNPVPIPITGLSYEVSLNSFDVLSGVSSDSVDLGAYGETEVRLEASTNLFGMMRLFTDFMSAQTSELEYELDASIGVRGFAKSFDINESGIVPLSK